MSKKDPCAIPMRYRVTCGRCGMHNCPWKNGGKITEVEYHPKLREWTSELPPCARALRRENAKLEKERAGDKRLVHYLLTHGRAMTKGEIAAAQDPYACRFLTIQFQHR